MCMRHKTSAVTVASPGLCSATNSLTETRAFTIPFQTGKTNVFTTSARLKQSEKKDGHSLGVGEMQFMNGANAATLDALARREGAT